MKYYMKDNGKEVKIGDTISVTSTLDTIFGQATSVTHIVVTQDNVSALLEHDILRMENVVDVPTCQKYIAKKLNTDENSIISLMDHMVSAGMMAPVLQMLLKAASDCLTPGVEVVKDTLAKVYTISLVNGSIYEIPTEEITNYDHFAYFVSKTQAKRVKRTFSSLFRAMYDK